MSILIGLISTSIALLVSTYLIPGFHVENFSSALFAAFVLGLLNIFVKPILLLLTLPVNILTLGLFSFVINAIVLLLATQFVPGFKIDGFLPALLGAIVVGFISGLIKHSLK